MVQLPVQQSPLLAHPSPGWTQNDEGWHVPDVQSPEQHAPLSVHAFPSVEHEVLSGLHLPLTQSWLQHWPLVVHAVLSEWHAGYSQLPFTQSLLQQSASV
jgi:hypothetical protein